MSDIRVIELKPSEESISTSQALNTGEEFIHKEVIGRASSKKTSNRVASQHNLLFTEKTLSRNHALLKIVSSGLLDSKPNVYIQDTGSQHGVVVNNQLLSKDQEIEIFNKQKIGLVTKSKRYLFDSTDFDETLLSSCKLIFELGITSSNVSITPVEIKDDMDLSNEVDKQSSSEEPELVEINDGDEPIMAVNEVVDKEETNNEELLEVVSEVNESIEVKQLSDYSEEGDYLSEVEDVYEISINKYENDVDDVFGDESHINNDHENDISSSDNESNESCSSDNNLDNEGTLILDFESGDDSTLNDETIEDNSSRKRKFVPDEDGDNIHNHHAQKKTKIESSAKAKYISIGALLGSAFTFGSLYSFGRYLQG